MRQADASWIFLRATVDIDLLISSILHYFQNNKWKK